MKTERILLALLVIAAALLAVLAGIGTSDSFGTSSSLWGGPDTVTDQSGK